MDRGIGSGNFLAIRAVRFGPLGHVESAARFWVLVGGDEAVPEACPVQILSPHQCIRPS
jgi:hypothetical protein